MSSQLTCFWTSASLRAIFVDYVLEVSDVVNRTDKWAVVMKKTHKCDDLSGSKKQDL
jgi:hypothetical protein